MKQFGLFVTIFLACSVCLVASAPAPEPLPEAAPAPAPEASPAPAPAPAPKPLFGVHVGVPSVYAYPGLTYSSYSYPYAYPYYYPGSVVIG